MGRPVVPVELIPGPTGDLFHIAGAHDEEQITRRRRRPPVSPRLLERCRERRLAGGTTAKRGIKVTRRPALDLLLRGPIDRRDDHLVDSIESGREIRAQRPGTGIPMGLEDCANALASEVLRRPDESRDLGGMMGIIRNDLDVVALHHMFETTARQLDFLKPRDQPGLIHAKFQADRNCRKRIADIMRTRRREMYDAGPVAVAHEDKLA